MNSQIPSSPFNDQLDRSELAQFEGQKLRFEGVVINVSTPSKGKKFSCIRNARVTPINNDIAFQNAEHIKLHHVWVDVTECTHMKHRIGQVIEAVGVVHKYHRKDGSTSFGLRLAEGHTSEAGLFRQMASLLQAINCTSGLKTQEEKAVSVNALIAAMLLTLDSGQTILFNSTDAELRRSLRDYKSALMVTAGVHTTINREGRRLTRTARHRKPIKAKAHGFA